MVSIMLRQRLSNALVDLADIVARDQSKEKILAAVKDARYKIAKAIAPKD